MLFRSSAPATVSSSAQAQAQAQQQGQSYSQSQSQFHAQAQAQAQAGLLPPEQLSAGELKRELAARGVPPAEWGLERAEMAQRLRQARAGVAPSGANSADNNNNHSHSNARPMSSGVSRLPTAAAAAAAANSAAAGATGEPSERSMDGLRAEVDQWAAKLRRDVRAMLNDVNGAKAGSTCAWQILQHSTRCLDI